MGSWNGTCGLTGLPITAGDEVIAFLIGVVPHTFGGRTRSERDYAANDSSGFCYPTDYAFPISLPFFGKYDDYGSVEDIGKGTFWLEQLRDFISPDKKDLAIERFVADEVERDQTVFRVEEGQAHYEELKYSAKDGLGVGLFMVLKSAVEAVLSIREAKTARATKYRFYRHPTLEQYIEGGALRYKRVLNNLGPGKLPWTRWQEEREPDYTKDEPLSNLVPHALVSRGLGGPTGQGSNFHEAVTLPAAERVLREEGLDSPKLKELSELCFWVEVVATSMAMTRGSWLPKSGKGSQLEDYSYYLAFADVAKQKAEEQRKKYQEWGMDADVYL